MKTDDLATKSLKPTLANPRPPWFFAYVDFSNDSMVVFAQKAV